MLVLLVLLALRDVLYDGYGVALDETMRGLRKKTPDCGCDRDGGLAVARDQGTAGGGDAALPSPLAYVCSRSYPRSKHSSTPPYPRLSPFLQISLFHSRPPLTSHAAANPRRTRGAAARNVRYGGTCALRLLDIFNLPSGCLTPVPALLYVESVQIFRPR